MNTCKYFSCIIIPSFPSFNPWGFDGIFPNLETHSTIPVSPDRGLLGSFDGRAPKDCGNSRDCPDRGPDPTEPEGDRTSSARLVADRPGLCGQSDPEPVLDPGADRASSAVIQNLRKQGQKERPTSPI